MLSEPYFETLETPTARRLRVLPSIEQPLLQYDYAGPHTFARTAEARCLNCTVLGPPTDSPALAQSDFQIFTN
jgi:hypothetical protein